MSGLIIDGVSKSYGTVNALKSISLEIEDGKFVCLLGPSGCGKTTLLRIVAGLETATIGKVVLDSSDISAVPAHKRDFGMVFQSLALFPHLSVAENVAYPLAIRGMGKTERMAKAAEALDLVHLPGRGDRAISQLSGGQRQRVAIARALVMQPKLFLLDEPMSALDAKLREHMQIELKRLQRDLAVTSLLVTHDQREAMTTADLVVVMSEGEVQQVAPPLEIYRNPANAFVADFIGITNLIAGQAENGVFHYQGQQMPVAGLPANGPVTLSVRPEDLNISTELTGPGLTGTVAFIRRLGATTEITLETEGACPEITVSLPGRTECPVTVGQKARVDCTADAAVVLG